ncbi:hypothetical protein D3C75_788940 [compost metagenome]
MGRFQIAKNLGDNLLLGMGQGEGQPPHKIPDLGPVNLVGNAVGLGPVQEPVRLHLQLEQEQLLIDHPPAGSLSLTGVCRLMQNRHRFLAGNKPVLLHQLLRQHLADHIAELRQRLFDHLPKKGLGDPFGGGVYRLQGACAPLFPRAVGKLRRTHNDSLALFLPFARNHNLPAWGQLILHIVPVKPNSRDQETALRHQSDGKP